MKKILRGLIVSSSIILGVIAYSYASPIYCLTIDDVAQGNGKELVAFPGFHKGEIEIRWIVPNILHDWQHGVASYEVRLSGSPIDTEQKFNNAAVYPQSWKPKAKGEEEKYFLTGLNPGQLYYVSIKATDNADSVEEPQVPEDIITQFGPPPYQGNISNYDPDTGIGSCACAIARAQVIGVSIEGSYNFGEINIGGQAISSGCFSVKNIGDEIITCLLSLNNPPGWTAVQSQPIGHDQYILNVMFNSTKPGSFNNNQHSLSIVPVECGTSPNGKFSGNDEDGVALSSGEVTHLWVEFKAPQTTSIGAPQTISICVSAQSP